MNNPKPISRAPLSPETLNYRDLLSAGVARAQTLSGDHWTDYNEHDPGVTILQSLCFALTDLGYRTAHPIEDILASSMESRADGQELPKEEQPLFTGDKVLACAPFTINDYRKLIYDLVSGVKNVWLKPVKDHPAGVRGLYDVLVQTFPPPGRAVAGDEPSRADADIREDIRACLQAWRSLGEDFQSVELLKPRELKLKAEIEIDAEADADDLVADLLFSVDIGLNPPPEVQDVDGALQRGTPPDELFQGPSLELGVIADESLAGLRTDAPVEQVMQIMLSVEGVLRVPYLSLDAEGESDADGTAEPMAVTIIPSPTSEAAIGHIIDRIKVLRGGEAIPVVAKRVKSSLAHREQRRRWAVIYARKRMEDVAYKHLPLGNPRRELFRYRSIQHLFPSVYGISRYGLGEGASAVISGLEDQSLALKRRQADALQFKAYLLFFEQMLANYLAQLNDTARLFSFAKFEPTYAAQVLVHPPKSNDDDPPNIDPILSGRDQDQSGDDLSWFEHYKKEIEQIARDHDPFLDRRERALNHLLARFNERFDDERLQQLSGLPPSHRDEFLKGLIERKRQFLADYVHLSQDRSLGISLIGPEEPVTWPRDISTWPEETPLLKRVRLLSGLEAPFQLIEHILLRDSTKPLGIGKLKIDTDFRIRAPAPVRAVQIGDDQLRIEGVIDQDDPVEGWVGFRRELVARAADEENYEVYPSGTYRAALRLRGQGSAPAIEILQEFPAADEAERAKHDLAKLFERIAAGKQDRHEFMRPVLLPYDFFAQRVTAVFPAEPDGSNSVSPALRDFVELTLRRNLPVHIAVDCFWLGRVEMKSLAEDYTNWLAAKRLQSMTLAPLPVIEDAAAVCSGTLRHWIHKLYCSRVRSKRRRLRHGGDADEDAGNEGRTAEQA